MDLDIGDFYIGIKDDRPVEPVGLPGDNLTTHGVIVGMTGSGKTGLGVNILEESLLNGIPTLILDPKGDMGNLLLTFPGHDPRDYEPWVNAAEAEQAAQSVAEFAAVTAAERSAKLAEHGLDEARITRLRDTTDMVIYTPGSEVGVGLNLLGSFEAASLDWATDSEVLRDEIEALVSSLLLLAGIESDPVSGREHILLSSIVESWWRQGRSLDLATLVGQVARPPFRKLGVFELDTFFPQKDRTDLALRLNGLLASPAFSSWLGGRPLDIDSLIGGGDKTRCAIVYMAHLTDDERQFVVTLILSKLITWIRRQPGSSKLRALVYMDEAFGYAPPVAEPPSKKPIMTILKQARAFGVGMLLVTQNPVDLDHKAMSNTGTWIVGRLQTENDKRRILDGMQSVETTGELGDLISNLRKHEFILHQVKRRRPEVFKRRRSMSFRIGPLTRDQVSFLMAGRRTKAAEASAAPAVPLQALGDTTSLAPSVADGITVKYLDPAAPWAGAVGAEPTGTRLEPAAVATVQLLYDDTKAGVNHSETYESVVFPLDGVVDPAEVIAVDHDERDFSDEPPDGASYPTLAISLRNKTFWTGLQSDLKTHLVANRPLVILHNPDLGFYSRVGETESDFRSRCRAEAESRADADLAALTARFKTRIDRAKDQVSAADARVRELEGDASAKKQEEMLAGAGDLLGALLGGRSSSNPLGRAASRRTATRKAEARADSAGARLAGKQTELDDLESDLADAITAISDDYKAKAENVVEHPIGLEKTDIRVADLKLVWVPVG